MNVGKAITGAMRAQRKKDIERMLRWVREFENYRHYGPAAHDRLLAYWWWGWDINGKSGLGKPGADL